ncbi:MAG TPA: AAA family ATPase [Acidimicrobiales bacterium]|nr:AAA family ATPase [Acidimicrobiales bacterium]
MTYRLLVGVADGRLADEVAALTEESAELTVAGSATSGSEVIDALGALDPDVVVLHEELGPLPAMDLAREVALRVPHVGIVLIVRDSTPEVLRAALQCGVRDVVTTPLSFEEFQTAATSASSWSRAVRHRVAGDLVEPSDAVGSVLVAFAGAKGGVGTTTLAVHLACEAVRSSPHRSVCLVDLDLQSGDVGGLLNVNHHQRSVLDLVEVADDLSDRSLEESLYVHPSGLRVLLAPREGERSEEVVGPAARRILAAIKSRFDLVVVDCGAVMTEAGAVAAEVADRTVVLTTPDVAALRAANRLLALWARLQIRKPEDVTLVVNRSSREREVQPDLVRRVVAAPLGRTPVPDGLGQLEAATNTGVPDRLPDGPVRRAIRELALELGLVTPRRAARFGRRGDAGQVTAETVGVTFVLMVVALFLWQVVVTGYTYVLAGHAAREGARRLAVGEVGAVVPTVSGDLPSPWRDGMRVAVGDYRVEVTLRVPAVVPGYDTRFSMSASAGTVREDRVG